MLERWTRAMLRHRVVVAGAWIAVGALGAWAATALPAHLATSLAVPGTDSDRARTILRERFGQPDDGVFTVVFPTVGRISEAERQRLARRVSGAASVIPGARAGELRDGGAHFADVVTGLGLAEAKEYTDELRQALRTPGDTPALVTGQPAIQRDLDPVFAADLRRGELIAVAVALVVLVFLFGLSPALAVPFVMAAATVTATLAAVYVIAQGITMVTYVTNLVALVGLALAVDYSLLIVLRFREELARAGATVDEAIVRTMATAGRATVVSGLAVALGLAALLLVPVPLIRSLGVAGLLIPLASILAAVTLQPVLLSFLGERGVRRRREGARDTEERGGWARLARAIMRRPVPFLAASTAVLLAAAVPVLALEVTPGSVASIPTRPESVRGYDLLRESIGPGGITPVQVVVDTGSADGARAGGVRGAVDRLADLVFGDAETKVVASGPEDPYTDSSGRYTRLVIAGRHEFGDEETQRFVDRLREMHVPAARFPPDARVVVGGAPAQGIDFLDRAYGAFPWIALALLAVTYLVLARAFQSLLLPLKAVLLNLLSVGAAYGLLVVIFRWDVGAGPLGLQHADRIEAWVPIFLFTVLFGVSMDYEVFLVSRMREAWDAEHDNVRAVALGLQRTGPVVTAAAVIMIGAFLGFGAGRVSGLEQLGVGLALAVLIDATIVRAVLLPSAMAILGRYNWWLPAWAARLVATAPSPLRGK